VTGPEADAAAHLLERLLTDPVLRKRFRSDPVAASREAGVDSLASEMSHASGKAMETLDGRESRSSLAGVFMAAAVEGAAAYEVVGELVPHLDGIPESVGKVLSRVDLAAIPGLHVDTAEAAEPPANAAGEFRAVVPAANGAGAAEHVDAALYGQEGRGASPSQEAAALLHNKRVAFDADGIADLKAGRIDPRVASVLSVISRDHEISVSAMMSDHDKQTAGGSISNHYYGRAVDIASIDGQAVGPGNQVAKEIAISLSRLDPAIRPSEIGSPWALPGAAYFTDAAHQNHLHVAFDDPIAGNWKAPEDVAAGGAGSLPAEPAPSPALDVPQDVDQETDDGGDSDEEAEEPGGLEDPGGDTDAEADEESDGDEDNDSISDDPSDEAEDEEEEDEDEEDEEDEGDEEDEDSEDSSDSDDSSDSEGSADFEGPADSGDTDADGDTGDPGDSGDLDLDLGGVDGGYPGDDASQGQIAAWMAGQAQKRGVPAELPVMAALVESGLRNVPLGDGDADSAGFFQMRVGIWNKGDYGGYPQRPELQLKWFLDQAAAMKRQRVGSGKPIDEPSSYGEWIADVERPAAQFRGRYQERLEEAQKLLKDAMGNRRERGGDGAGSALDALGGDGAVAGGPRALAAVAEAKKYLGTPYQWGGSSPKTGFDCSGLVQWAYAKAGIRIPRVTDQQILASNGRSVDRRHLIPGDLVFFRDSSGYVHHVGMSLGGDKFLHAPHTGDVVKISSLKESYYAQQFTGGRRFDLSAAREPDRSGARAVASAARSLPVVDPDAVRNAEAALARDAAEAQRSGTLLFEAVRAQEIRKANVEAGRG
jgi:cell wall-associated NlpC family hydrolase